MAWAQIFITLLLVTFILLYNLLKRNKRYWKNLRVTGPKPDILFGNYKDVILRRVASFELHEQIYNAYPKEKIVGLYRFNTPVLLLRDLDIIQHVLIRGFDSFVNRGFDFGRKLNHNLASSTDDTWRALRTRLSPIFTSGKLKNMLYLIESCGDKMLEITDSEIPSSMECNVYNIAKSFAVGSISACVFGLNMDMKNPDENLVSVEKLVFKLHYGFEWFYLCPRLLNMLNFDPMPSAVFKYFSSLVEAIKKQRDGVPSKRKDFMDLLLEMKNMSEIKGGRRHEDDEAKKIPITDEMIAAQLLAFYIAGFDTSTTITSFALHELAKNQAIQQKVFEEINHVLKENNGEFSLDSFKQMTYLTQVFDETLRMYPVVDIQRKVSAESCQLPGTHITMKRDDNLYISVRGIHYDENYYPDPYTFDPDRFSPENAKSRHPCAYLPFGLGPRNCIGIRFARISSFMFIVKFLARYRVEPATVKGEFEYDPMKFTLSAKGGVPLKVIRRNN